MVTLSSTKNLCFYVKVAQSCPTLRPHGLYSPWNSPGQNSRVDCHSLLQGIFPTQGSNSGLPHCRWILYQQSHQVLINCISIKLEEIIKYTRGCVQAHANTPPFCCTRVLSICRFWCSQGPTSTDDCTATCKITMTTRANLLQFCPAV